MVEKHKLTPCKAYIYSKIMLAQLPELAVDGLTGFSSC